MENPGEIAVLNEVADYVTEYVETIGRPPSGQIVNRRFGVRAKNVTGMPLLELLRKHSDLFVLSMNERGGRDISCRTSPVADRIVTILRKTGPISSTELLDHFKGSGLRVSDVMGAQAHLNEKGKIAVKDGIMTLVD